MLVQRYIAVVVVCTHAMTGYPLLVISCATMQPVEYGSMTTMRDWDGLFIIVVVMVIALCMYLLSV